MWLKSSSDWRPAAALALVASAVGCDPLASVVVRQRLVPSPTPQCIAPALAAAPHVAQVQKRKQKDAHNFRIVLRDSLAKDSLIGANFALETLADSVARGTIHFVWIGALANFQQTQQDRWLALGSTVLAALRSACAPATIAAPECTELEWAHERSRPCPPAT